MSHFLNWYLSFNRRPHVDENKTSP
jgi:hypothetical protein